MPGINQKSNDDAPNLGGGGGDSAPATGGSSNRGFWILAAAFAIAAVIYRIFR